ncbi:hypothetical protein V9L13_06425 [Pseudomonas sp. RSB 5.4]|uniref:hypothetical protein n=1 Tax=Pseudomonas sp. RSB 5.4 TaxID=3127459 RepID=UPI0030D1F4BA
MNTTSTDKMEWLSEERRQVETYCQSLVSAGAAQWRINENGDPELHLESGEAFLFGNVGVTRLK